MVPLKKKGEGAPDRQPGGEGAWETTTAWVGSKAKKWEEASSAISIDE